MAVFPLSSRLLWKFCSYIYMYKLQDFAIELLLYSWVSYHVDHCIDMDQLFVLHCLKFKVSQLFDIVGRRKWIQNDKKWKVLIVKIESYFILSSSTKVKKKSGKKNKTTEAGLNLPKIWTYIGYVVNISSQWPFWKNSLKIKCRDTCISVSITLNK